MGLVVSCDHWLLALSLNNCPPPSNLQFRRSSSLSPPSRDTNAWQDHWVEGDNVLTLSSIIGSWSVDGMKFDAVCVSHPWTGATIPGGGTLDAGSSSMSAVSGEKRFAR